MHKNHRRNTKVNKRGSKSKGSRLKETNWKVGSWTAAGHSPEPLHLKPKRD